MGRRDCNVCGENKPLTNFVKVKSGYAKTCKPCHNARISERLLKRKAGTYINPKDVEFRKAEFKKNGTELNDGLYTYERVVYKDYHTRVEIFCTKHQGYFWQTPGAHLSGNGCVECYAASHTERGLANRLTQQDFIDKTHLAHGDKYTLLNAVYAGALTHVYVTCPTHGDFPIAPHNLWAGYGCPGCSPSGYNREKPGSIYVLVYDNITKIGITNRDVKIRAGEISKSSGKNFEILFSQRCLDGCIPLSVEWVTKLCLGMEHDGVDEKYDGYTESFVNVDRTSLLKIIKQHIINMENYNDNYRPDNKPWAAALKNE